MNVIFAVPLLDSVLNVIIYGLLAMGSFTLLRTFLYMQVNYIKVTAQSVITMVAETAIGISMILTAVLMIHW